MPFLVRHGESTGNQNACLQGARIGGTLSGRGRQQSFATALYLFEAFEELRRGNVLLVSSPSTRALETAAPIAKRLNCAIGTDHGLEELDFGEWSGTLVADLESDAAYQRWKADPWARSPPQGETLAQVRSRMWEATSRYVTRATSANRPLVLVTHFFPLMSLFETLKPGTPVRCDNASISRFEVTDTGWAFSLVNEVRHLNQAAPVPVRYV
ncbi:MAG: histidine phosphatase family protein [Pseudorhodoplanes sp.]